MPLNIDKLTSDVTVFNEDELPLSPQQLEKLVQIVLSRLEKQQQTERLNQTLMSFPAGPDKLPWQS